VVVFLGLLLQVGFLVTFLLFGGLLIWIRTLGFGR